METVFVIIGFILRLGIPLALTAGLVRWLRQLDARWQLQAEQARRAWPAMRPSTFAPLCWEARGCSAERRTNCPAFVHPDVPCWQIFRNEHGHLKEACLECKVFRQAPVPVMAQR